MQKLGTLLAAVVAVIALSSGARAQGMDPTITPSQEFTLAGGMFDCTFTIPQALEQDLDLMVAYGPNVSGNTTVTIPHGMTSVTWTVTAAAVTEAANEQVTVPYLGTNYECIVIWGCEEASSRHQPRHPTISLGVRDRPRRR